jgi:hypothetical protein
METMLTPAPARGWLRPSKGTVSVDEHSKRRGLDRKDSKICEEISNSATLTLQEYTFSNT